MGKNKKKRSLAQYERDGDNENNNTMGIGATLSYLKNENQPGNGDDEGWTTVHRGNKKQKTMNVPGLVYSELHKLQSIVNLNHLQGLVLYCLADGNMAPSWVSLRHHGLVQKAVVLCVPGLEKAMFDGSMNLEPTDESTIDAPLRERLSTPDDALNGLLEKLTDTDQIVEHRSIPNPFIGTANGNGNVTSVQNGVKPDSFVPTSNPSNQTNGSSNNSAPKSNQPLKPAFQSPDDYLPIPLVSEKLPLPLKPLAGTFAHMWPIKAPGDERSGKVHSPLHAMLNSQLTKTQEQKAQEKLIKGPKPAKEGIGWENKRTPITHYLTSKEDLLENEYVLHPASLSDSAEKDAAAQRRAENKQTSTDGWVDTHVTDIKSGSVEGGKIEQGSMTAGRSIIALDCEMCLVQGGEYALTRISLLDWDGTTLLDELVKPDKPIIDYLTQYSGMTEAKLGPITTTLPEIQARLLELITPNHILIGHSLNSDLNAMKLTHPFITDTSILYPHPRGPPMKSSLKWLAQKYLSREIQKGQGKGHDSIEDARACLDLVKVKCEKGPLWGTYDATTEPIFKRLKRIPKIGQLNDGEHGKTGTIVDHGAPEKTFGNMADYCISCKTDAEVVKGIQRAVSGDEDGAYIPSGGVDLTWARLQELANLRGWLVDHRNSNTNGSTNTPSKPSPADLTAMLKQTVQYIQDIRDSLPKWTLFIVYSGTGDPREMGRLQELQRTFKREYRVKKWDELSVKWTDTEEQALKLAVRKARAGVGFVCIT